MVGRGLALVRDDSVTQAAVDEGVGRKPRCGGKDSCGQGGGRGRDRRCGDEGHRGQADAARGARTGLGRLRAGLALARVRRLIGRQGRPSTAVHDVDVHDEPFDQLMAMLDYPVFVVTTQADGQPSGCRVSFATQISVRPPRFLVVSRTTATTSVGEPIRSTWRCTYYRGGAMGWLNSSATRPSISTRNSGVAPGAPAPSGCRSSTKRPRGSSPRH